MADGGSALFSHPVGLAYLKATNWHLCLATDNSALCYRRLKTACLFRAGSMLTREYHIA